MLHGTNTALATGWGFLMSAHTDVLSAGIIVADHVSSPISHLPAAGELVLADQLLLTIGGCAANVAVDLGKLGVVASVVGRVGDDVLGRVVSDMLRERGVDVSLVHTTPGLDTSQTLIVNVAGQDRRFIHTFGANAAFRAADIPPDRATRCRVLYLGGYLLMENVLQDQLIPVFAAARRAGTKTVLDVVTPGPSNYLGRLEKLMPHVDVFLPNNHEGQLITGESDPLKQAELFHQTGAATAIVTLGDGGAVLVGEGVRLRSGTYKVPFVDATGGGDAFAAGYILGLLQGLDAEGCLRTGSAVGASCVRAIGTTTGVFTRADCEAFMRENALIEPRRTGGCRPVGARPTRFRLGKNGLQPVNKRHLVRVQQLPRPLQRHELRLIDLPRRAARRRVGGRRSGERIDALLALLVVDKSDFDEFAGLDAGFLARLAAGGLLHCRLVGVGQALRDAPRLATVVVARRVDEQHFQAVVPPAVKQRAGRFFHVRAPQSRKRCQGTFSESKMRWIRFSDVMSSASASYVMLTRCRNTS
jgi:sugar/nucleoside kinase (ribokinase family)